MDEFWQAVADYINAKGLPPDQIVGPVDLTAICPIGHGYINVGPADVDRIQVLAIHKGRYRELAPDFLRAALARLRPTFANEVFIVFTADDPALAFNNQHLGAMRRFKEWSVSGNASDAVSADAPAPETGRHTRMPAVYIGNDQVLAQTASGQLVVLAANDRSITPHIIRDGYFDAGLTSFLQRTLRPGMVFVDVGANMGVYALVAAAAVGHTGRVIAIEAIPRLAQMVSDNLVMNGFLKTARVLPVAAANEEGELTIYEFDRLQGGNTMLADVAHDAEKLYSVNAKPLTVRAVPLSILFEREALPAPNLIKIDVEGFELQVLLGARSLIAKHKPHLIMEWHPTFMVEAETPERLYEILTKELGYTIQRIEQDGRARPIDFVELMSAEHSDIYCAF